jgi:hypothetical protein
MIKEIRYRIHALGEGGRFSDKREFATKEERDLVADQLRSEGVSFCIDRIIERHQIKVGDTFGELINQKTRNCEIVKITKTRFRVEYEMPSGTFGSWRYHQDLTYTISKRGK